MAKKKSEFLSAFGVAFEIWKSFVETLLDEGGSDDDLRRIGTDPSLRREIAKLVVGKKVEVRPSGVRIRRIDENTLAVTVPVNYDDRMDSVSGHDWTNADSRKDTVAKRSGIQEVEIILRRFGCRMTSPMVADAFARDGCEPIMPEELRDLKAVAENDPDLPIPIAALGASWQDPDGDRGVLYLNENAGKQYLVLFWSENDWLAYWWFGARRK